MNNTCIMEIMMCDYYIEEIEHDYEQCAEQDYQDYLVYIFHEFLYDMKTKCIPPRTYNVSFDLKTVHSFWEVA